MCYESGKQLQMIKREREEEGDRQSSTFSRLLILYLSSGFVLFGIKTSSLDNVVMWGTLLLRTHIRQERSEYTLFSMLIRARSGTTYGNCSCSYVTYFQRDEVERAGARGNSRTGLATIL